jgi:two-component system, response regulator RegA
MNLNNSNAFLIVDDDNAFCYVMQRALARRNIPSHLCNCAEAALAAMQTHRFTQAIVDLKIAQDSGLALIKNLLLINPDIRIVMLTGYSSVSTAVEAIKLGAINYLCKPLDVDTILAAFEHTAMDNPDINTTIISAPPSLDRMEWEHIQKTLLANNGNISATARELGMHRRTLQRKLTKRPSAN